VVTLYFQITDPAFRAPILGVAVYYAIAVGYFAAVGRRRLVLSPEEEFAMRGGRMAERAD
jgi:ethanolamine permease